MDKYTEIRIDIPEGTPDWLADVVVSRLEDLGYDGFVEEENSFSAFIPQDLFDNNQLDALILSVNMEFQTNLTFTTGSLPDINWNEQWEKNFPSVVIADLCYVRAPFHPERKDIPYELIIEPKMSFGTAHHETTQMMIEFMLEMEFKGKKVVDMGTGTGILAILCRKLGAAEVLAIDNDEWSFLNAKENVVRNEADNIEVKLGDVGTLHENGCFDVILANITRNILLTDIPGYLKHLKPDGYLLLSGFYKDDIPVFLHRSTQWNLKIFNQKEKNNWVSLLFQKF